VRKIVETKTNKESTEVRERRAFLSWGVDSVVPRAFLIVHDNNLVIKCNSFSFYFYIFCKNIFDFKNIKLFFSVKILF
jgi:hypothetical protein